MTSRYADARLQIADYSTFLRKVRRDCPIWFVLYAELRGNHEQGAPGQLDAWLDKLFEHILVALPLAESAKIPSASVESVKTLRAECERLEHTVRALEEQRRSTVREVDATRKLIETVSAPSFLIEKRILSLNAEDARASEQLARSSEALTTARLLLAAHEESLEATTIGASALTGC